MEVCGGETVEHIEQASTDSSVAGSNEWSHITVTMGYSLGRPPRDRFLDSDNIDGGQSFFIWKGHGKTIDDHTFSSWSNSSRTRVISGTVPKASPSSHCGACYSFRA